MWEEKWNEACKKASFFSSEKNTDEYWDEVAKAGYNQDDEDKINLLFSFLKNKNLLDKTKTAIDVGCGTGNYVLRFAKEAAKVTALDYSKEMLTITKEKSEGNGLKNVDYICANFNTYQFKEKYDVVIAALNPGVYSSNAFDKLLSISNGTVVLLNQEGDINAAKNEPVYSGSHYAAYPISYAKEKGLKVDTIPVKHTVMTKEGKSIEIPFVYSIYRV